jgi:hypothetical protein
MSILWAGGEDIDFPNGVAPFVLATVGVHPPWRAAYARCALYQQSNGTLNGPISRGVLFSPVTSVWFSCQMFTNQFGAGAFNLNIKSIGLGQSATVCGLWIGTGGADSTKLALWKSDNVTQTLLATELGNSLATFTLYRLDVQVIDYGAAATVNVFLDGVLVITFTGDITVGAMTAFDSVIFTFSFDGVSNIRGSCFSEIVVADEDTRGFAVQTLAPAGPGTVSNWTGAWSDINEIGIDDSNEVGVNALGQDWQCTLLPLVAGNPTTRAVMISARTASPAGSVATKAGLGVNCGGLVDPGVLQSPVGASWTTLGRLMPLNPVTGLPWTIADIGSLQLNLRSGA